MATTFWMTTRWALLPIIFGTLITMIVVPNFHWDSELFHVMVEAGGALIGFGLAFIIIAMIMKNQLSLNYTWLIACFISMGILDMIHSQQPPGQAFVWLHSLATLAGGLFAMLIWLPESVSEKFFKVEFFWGILSLSIGLGIIAVIWPDTVPAMLDKNQQFTWLATMLNFMGGLGFLIAWNYFAREYHQHQQSQLYYFSNHFALFGLAAFVFEFSALWDGNWWFWHILRAFAYTFLIFHFVNIYLRRIEEFNQELELNLQESNNRYKALVETTADWIWEIDANGLFTYVSPNLHDLLGYKPEEIIGKSPFELMSPNDAEYAKNVYRMLSSTKSPVHNFESIHLHKNGKPLVLEVNGIPILNDDKELLGYRGINRDITERKSNEQEIKAQRDFTNTILNAAGNVIVVLDLNGCFVRFNRAAEELTGFKSIEVIGKPIWDLVIPKEQLDGVKNVFMNLKNGNTDIASEYENEWLTRYGSKCLLHWRNSVLYDDDDMISHIVALGYDITEKKEIEIEHARIQSELQQAQKMESLGQLTGGIAHDFNNLLSIINGFSSLMLKKFSNQKNEKLTEYVLNIKEAGERAATLVAQMLVFSRGDQVKDLPIQFAPLIKEDIKMLRATLPSTIEIEDCIDINLPDVFMNPTQLHQILMNLSINARDAMNSVGKLSIRLHWALDLDTESPISHKPIKGDWIELSISDTGSGVDANMIQSIFNPFFTTKEVGQGTGMGLSVIYRIMENHNGHILLESEPGKGSKFSMLFSPMHEEMTMAPNSTKNDIEISMGDGSEILVVDDEKTIASYMSELLKDENYKAFAVTDSSEALELFRNEPDRFSMLITDQAMPKMTGSELISRVREFRPDLPVILCSGYSDKIDLKKAKELNISYFSKPVDSTKLLLKISDLIM